MLRCNMFWFGVLVFVALGSVSGQTETAANIAAAELLGFSNATKFAINRATAIHRPDGFELPWPSELSKELATTYPVVGEGTVFRNLRLLVDAHRRQVHLADSNEAGYMRSAVVTVTAAEISKLIGDAHPVLDSLACLLYTSPSPRDATLSRMPSSA